MSRVSSSSTVSTRGPGSVLPLLHPVTAWALFSGRLLRGYPFLESVFFVFSCFRGVLFLFCFSRNESFLRGPQQTLFFAHPWQEEWDHYVELRLITKGPRNAKG